MKNRTAKKRIVFIFALMFLCLVYAIPGFSATKASVVSYNGNTKRFSFNNSDGTVTTDLFTDIGTLMPGLTYTQRIDIKCKVADNCTTNIYLRAKGPVDVEDGTLWEGNPDKVIYQKVLDEIQLSVDHGDDNRIFTGATSETDGLTSPVLLISTNEDVTTQLNAEVTLPGSMGNEFQGVTGAMEWEFIVEELYDDIVPDVNVVEISKQVLDQDFQEFEGIPDVDYEFCLFYKTQDGFALVQNALYKMYGGENNGRVFSTGDEGTFILKNGEKAVFFAIPDGTELYVVENEPEANYVYTGAKVSLNGGHTKSYAFNEPSESTVFRTGKKTTFVFTNQMLVMPPAVEKEVTVQYKIIGAPGSGDLTNDLEKFSYLGDPEGSHASANEGFVFLGWYSDEECTNLLSYNPNFIPQKNWFDIFTSATYYAKIESYQLNATIPLYVCLYGYAGDGSVITPTNYKITNHTENIGIEVSDIDVKRSSWTVIPKYAGLDSLRPGEIFLNINGTSLAEGSNKPKDKWTISSVRDGSNVLPLPIKSNIAGGNVNDEGCVPVVKICYTVKPYLPIFLSEDNR